jgi:hypothetical protein
MRFPRDPRPQAVREMWRLAHWALYDKSIYGVSRLETFRTLVRLGFTPREAAELIQESEREP